MTPTPAERDQLFKGFGRAWLKQDLELMYQVVTLDFTWHSPADSGSRSLSGREAIAAEFARRKGIYEGTRFHDVVYHHAPDASFMTFRMTATEMATGKPVEVAGVERYSFRDGRIAVKDVYTRQAG